MRSERRKDRRRGLMQPEEKSFNIKNTLYIAGTILALGVIAFFVTVMVYNNSLSKIYADLETQEIGQLEDNTVEEASTNLGKTVDEMENTTVSAENEEVTDTSTEEETNYEEIIENNVETYEEVEAEEELIETVEETKELSFEVPVEGEIQKEYAMDKLVYSETLKEWVTHTGIDIKADKTTVVKAAEEGTVTAIKNDPRYGITVIIEHSGGYETRYANLLTAEFVSVGEEVTKGQTIGTVGDTGTFEILDEPHLHFELLKDGEYQDPTLIIQ